MLRIGNGVIDFVEYVFAEGVIPGGVTGRIGVSSKITSFDQITLWPFHRQWIPLPSYPIRIQRSLLESHFALCTRFSFGINTYARHPNMRRYDKSGILPIKAWNGVISTTASVEDRFFSCMNHKNPNGHSLLLTHELIIMLRSFSSKVRFARSETPF